MSERFPRMRGGDPFAVFYKSLFYNVFPACAGVILVPALNMAPVRSFPRMRGGDPLRALEIADAEEFSPHARG